MNTVPSPQSSGSPLSARRPDIQGLRAIAVLLVVAYHAGLPVPGGFIGVDVFFVISGFVITGMLQREWVRHGRIDFRNFYLRRFRRLTPALAVMVSFTTLAAAFILSPLGPQQTAAQTAVGALLLSANFVIANTTGGYFDAPAETNPLLHTWSLSVEEQFYLLFPALIAFGWAMARRRRGLAALPQLLVMCLAALSFSLVVADGTVSGLPEFMFGFYSPFSRVWEFAVGCTLALWGVRDRRPRLRGGASIFGLLLLGVAAWTIDASTPFPSTWTLLPVVGTALLLVGGGDTTHRISRLLSAPAMVRVGDWSYSIYLWHWPLIVFAGLLWPSATGVSIAAAVVSIVPALASYRWVEEPIRNLRRTSAAVLARLIIGTIGLPLLLAGSTHALASIVWKPAIPSKSIDAMRLHAGYVQGCHFEPQDGNRDPKPCRWNGGTRGKPVYLLGDSNAAHYVEGLIDSTKQLGRPLIAATSSGCPLLQFEIRGPGRGTYARACEARVVRVLRWMQQQPAGTVIISDSDEWWLSPDDRVVLDDGTVLASRASKVRAMGTALTRTVRLLQSAGHEVRLIQTIPHFDPITEWNPARCTLAAALRGCAHEFALAERLRETADVRSEIERVGTRTGAIVHDFSAEICPDGKCRSWDGTMPIYRDPKHITVAMSHALAGVFTRILA